MARRLYWLTGILLLVLTACGWQQYRFDAGRSGNNAIETSIGAGNVATLRPSWSAGADVNVSYLAPLVADGRVLAASGRDVRAFDEATGAPRWSQPAIGAGANIVSIVAHLATGRTADGSRGVVYAGEMDFFTPSHGNGTWGSITAYDAATGNLIWSNPVGGTISSILVMDNHVFAVVNRHLGDTFDFGGLVALEAGTGVVAFRVPMTGELTSLAGADGRVYIGGSAGVTVVPGAGCGLSVCQKEWTGVTGSSFAPKVSVAAGRVYASSRDRLAVFGASGCNAATCPALWTATGQFGEVAVGEGSVFVTANPIDNSFGEAPLAVFSAAGCGSATCSPLWTSNVSRSFGAPTIANGVVYTSGHGGPSEAWPAAGCRASRCAPLWSSGVNHDGVVEPFVADGRLFIGSEQIDTYTLPAG